MTESTETAHVHDETVQLRRSPKYGNFMALGAGIGVVTGVALAVSQPATGETGIEQIVGFLALALGAVGLGLGAVVALVFDRSFARHTRTVDATRTVVSPSTD